MLLLCQIGGVRAGSGGGSASGRAAAGTARAVGSGSGSVARGSAGAAAHAKPPAAKRPYRTAQQLLFSSDGVTAYVVDSTGGAVVVIDADRRALRREIAVGGWPTDAVLSRDGKTLYVTQRHRNSVAVVSLARGRVERTFAVGLEPYGIARAPHGERLYVTNSQSNTLSIIDPAGGSVRELPVGGRDPRYVTLSPDGRRVVVSDGLSRSLSILDARTGRLVEVRPLGRASLLREVALSPDGKWAFVAHVISHDEASALQMERGWIHANGISLARLDRKGRYVTLLLDRVLAGAANPWGLAVAPDGHRLYVTLAGVHELAIVDLDKARALARRTRPADVPLLARDLETVYRQGIARRVPIAGIYGPRAIALRPGHDELWVAGAFSEDVHVLDARDGKRRARIALAAPQPLTDHRRGEMLFNDARLCFQRWFSCASCHQEDATMDGLAWDLPNDGVGNAKSVKSLHDIHDTPPAMWSGVRKDIDAAVQAGQRFLGFLPVPERHRALVAFLSDPPRAPNPRRGRDRAAVARGARVFVKAGCKRCHHPPTFSDGHKHDLGLASKSDQRRAFDTPSLRECYRTAPYLHDGRAKTLRAIFTPANDPRGLHGKQRVLTPASIDDLLAYLRSL